MSIRVDRQGEIYNGIQIVEEIGNGVVLGMCEHGHIAQYNKYTLTNGSIKHCKICKELEKEYKRNIENKHNISYNKVTVGTQHGNIVVVKVLKSGGLIVKCQLCKKLYEMSLHQFCLAGVQCEMCSMSNRTSENYHLGEVVNGLKIIERTDKDRFLCKCIRCGNIETKDYTRLMTNRTAKCSMCKKDGTQQNERYNSDLKGMVIGGHKILSEKTRITSLEERYEANGLRIDEDKGKLPKEDSLVVKIVKVKCMDCGNEYNILKGAVISKAIVCTVCKGRKLVYECPQCGTKIRFARKSRLENARCGCGYYINVAQMLRELDIRDTVEQLRHQFNINSSKYIIHNNELIIFNVMPYYVGRNLKRYYEAICLRHNKKIILSQDEIETYNHDQCERGYNI